ncbi:STAS domain-containing protein [Pseudaestuariivita sp.]|uniref:STAS domain-containing protein n=1 Tax=Pseudaestuariivita sp. TaxID=2211669 RepID=UPI004059F74F
MELSSSTHGDAQIVVAREPRIDAAVAIQFKDRMKAETEGGSGRVILDLSQVDFIDSSGLGAIVAAMKQMSNRRRLELAGLTETVAKVFRLTRMDTIFVVHPTVEDALATAE